MNNLTILFSCVIALLLVFVWRVFDFVWLKPRKLEKSLRAQGLSGNSYRSLYGDFKQLVMMAEEAKTKPINLSDDIVHRTVPFFLETIKKYGKDCFIWLGPNPSVIILEPQIIKEVFLKNCVFQKPRTHPVAKFLVQGLVVSEGDEWTKR
ncbi:hypothetical protein ACH5RR_037238 [Cinchona calisaya]|uniref:Cytochrome P450 n=1 Tax=Cinchona calisaya TaxID=153742 RepID=A0ABD2Y9W9_9GENT